VGTFEYFAARHDHRALETLRDYAIERHYPEITDDGAERSLALIDQVIDRQIGLVVDWLRVGFIHGVMNTDNTAISGQTIDFGPCAMLGVYDLKTVYSSIDRMGRYAFGNQPAILQWNLARFAETLLPLIDRDEKAAVDRVMPLLEGFSDRFLPRYQQMMAHKLGLSKTEPADLEVIAGLLDRMERQRMDYTQTFDRLTEALSAEPAQNQVQQDLGDWYALWQKRLADQPDPMEEAKARMRRSNPVVVPRNHHMEAVLESCIRTGEAASAEAFLDVLRSPYQMRPETALYQDAPVDEDRHYQTFCGT
jgi:uncharacterized protein YdiU (UPF0061 family)